MPNQRQLLEEEYRQVKEHLQTNRLLLSELHRGELEESGVALAKVRVGIVQVEEQIQDDERRLDELKPRIEAAAQAGPQAEPEMPRLPFEPETILMPAGSFLMGSADPAAPAAEQPPHTVELPDFRIGRYPVTQREYAAFIRDAPAQPTPRDWFNRQPSPDHVDHPVTDVSWYDALAYCDWLFRQTGRRYTLPSEAEWEKACSNDFSRSVEDRTTEVVTTRLLYVEDLLGNVQEWTRSLWGGEVARSDFVYPYRPEDGREVFDPRKLPAGMRLAHRGGLFKSPPNELRCTARGSALADSRIAWRGFRVAMMSEEK